MNYAAFATQSLFMASLKVLLLHSQKWLPKQVNVAEPASRHYGPKMSPKNNLLMSYSLPEEEKMARASALAPQAMYGYMSVLSIDFLIFDP